MATNTVNQILEKEKQADNTVAGARENANTIIEDAKEKAEDLKQQILADADKKAQELVAKVQFDTDKMYEDARAEAEKRAKHIISASAEVKSKATEIIKDIVF